MVCVYCTNVHVLDDLERLEERLGIVVLDSVAVTYWAVLARLDEGASLDRAQGRFLSSATASIAARGIARRVGDMPIIDRGTA